MGAKSPSTPYLAAARLLICGVMEEVARMARLTEQNNQEVLPAPRYIQEKHFYRKHGENAYYGQG